MGHDWPHPGLSSNPVSIADAELQILSELFRVRLSERQRTRRRKGVSVEFLAADAMQSMEWRRVRPRA